MKPEKQRTIIHIDDDPNITTVVQAKLSKHGYKTIAVNDSTTVMDLLTTSEHRVLLLDIDMPGKDGLTLLKEIKQFDGGLQVLMLTGLVSLTTILETQRGGAEACFFKPLEDITPLLEALDTTFHKIDRWWSAANEFMTRKKMLAVQ